MAVPSSHKQWVWPILTHYLMAFLACFSNEAATLRWHSLQTGDSYNLDVLNFVAARFWPVFALWPSFRRNFGHGLCHLKVALPAIQKWVDPLFMGSRWRLLKNLLFSVKFLYALNIFYYCCLRHHIFRVEISIAVCWVWRAVSHQGSAWASLFVPFPQFARNRRILVTGMLHV